MMILRVAFGLRILLKNSGKQKKDREKLKKTKTGEAERQGSGKMKNQKRKDAERQSSRMKKGKANQKKHGMEKMPFPEDSDNGDETTFINRRT